MNFGHDLRAEAWKMSKNGELRVNRMTLIIEQSVTDRDRETSWIRHRSSSHLIMPNMGIRITQMLRKTTNSVETTLQETIASGTDN